MVDNAPVHFLRYYIVKATVSCFHVVHRYALALGNYGLQPAIGIPQDKHLVGLLFVYYHFNVGNCLGYMAADGCCVRCYVVVRLSQLQLIKEYIAEPGIKVLAGMYQYVLA